MVCNSCHIDKPLSSFRKRRLPKRGYYGDCRQCESSKNIKRREKDPNYYGDSYRKRVKRSPDYMKIRRIERYNISVQDYNNLLEKQNHSCAICGIHSTKIRGRLHIDHDHITGKVRGLLCLKCNSGLGMFNDNIEIINNCIKYLKR